MSVADIIQHSLEEKPASLKDSFNNAILDKIKDQIDLKYADVVNNIFNNDTDEEDTLEVDDELPDDQEFESDDLDLTDDEFDDSEETQLDDEADDSELAEEGYEPNPKDAKNPEVQFIAKHIIKQFGVINGKDFAGNSIDGPPYKGGVKALDRNPKHGYNTGQDEKVYD